jgi:hypothetical protein
MLPLDDPRWRSYTGGYRVPYDASLPLRRLFEEGATSELWDELWQELYHQRDVGPASLAAVPWLLEYARQQPELDWNPFGLIAVIELERVRYCRNSPMPSEWLSLRAGPATCDRRSSSASGMVAHTDAAHCCLHCSGTWSATSGQGLPRNGPGRCKHVVVRRNGFR